MVDISVTLPDDFFNEEVFEGIHISRKIKEVQAIQLNIWREVDRICKKHNIPYWADGGTLLGTVRHGGFIPWDYDMDLMMRRNDYERFIKICDSELKYPFRNDDFRFSKVKDMRTFMAKKRYVQYNPNSKTLCIFIDIFPFDNVDMDDKEIVKTVVEAQEMVRYLMGDYNNKRIFLRPNKNLFVKKLKKKCNKYNDVDTGYICNLVVPYHKGCIKSLEDFKTTKYLKFEGFDMPVPGNYEHVLTDLFGDWKKPVLSEMGSKYYVNTSMNFDEIKAKKIDWENDSFIDIDK